MRGQIKQRIAKVGRRKAALWQTVSLFGITHALSACGGGGDDDKVEPTNPGAALPRLQPEFDDPYWVDSLISGRTRFLPESVTQGDEPMKVAFPTFKPAYLDNLEFENSQYVTGWAPVPTQVIEVYDDILGAVSEVFDVEFEIVSNPSAPDVISMQVVDPSAYQGLFGVDVAGFAVPPFEWVDETFLGYDIFFGDSFVSPEVLPSGLVNFDYTVAVHELGHALGLKHPHEIEIPGEVAIPSQFDTPQNSVMYVPKNGRYDETAFTGFFQPFDMMALARLYGVNPEYNSTDTGHGFDDEKGVFVLDGSGTDAINAIDQTDPVFISLVPETQSYVGTKSIDITDPFQLTISFGSEIEIASGGSGDDVIIGNDLDNVLFGRGGDDSIFGGDGSDTIFGGSGADVIDLSETAPARDLVTLAKDAPELIGGFDQGFEQDTVKADGLSLAPLLDVYTTLAAEAVTLSGEILRIAGVVVSRDDDIAAVLQENGVFDWLQIDPGEDSFLIIAASQNPGEAQIFAQVDGVTGDIVVLAEFVGSDMDIDLWNDTNFI